MGKYWNIADVWAAALPVSWDWEAGNDASLNLKGIGRALIPEIMVDIQGESSAGHEPSPYPTPPLDPEIQSESTSLWKREGSLQLTSPKNILPLPNWSIC